MRPISNVLLAVLLLAVSSAALAKGRLGFSIQVATDGMLSTTLREVKISGVRPGGPAELAGLRAGDAVTEFAGIHVAGANGIVLKKNLAAIKKGEHLKLLVLRAGKAMPIDIVAGADQ